MSKELFLKQNKNAGETYAGIILGERDYHVFLIAGQTAGNWQRCMDWAASAGGLLPNKREQSLLIANCREEFGPNWYWSNTQNADATDCAWMQNFYSGRQSNYRKLYEYSARAVRILYVGDEK